MQLPVFFPPLSVTPCGLVPLWPATSFSSPSFFLAPPQPSSQPIIKIKTVYFKTGVHMQCCKHSFESQPIKNLSRVCYWKRVLQLQVVTEAEQIHILHKQTSKSCSCHGLTFLNMRGFAQNWWSYLVHGKLSTEDSQDRTPPSYQGYTKQEKLRNCHRPKTEETWL